MKSNNSPQLLLGYDLDIWNAYGLKQPITIDLSPGTNSHILLCGMSGSGKSYLEQSILCKLFLAESDGEIFFADYKSDDSFAHLRNCPRYYRFKDTLDALEIVYSRLQARQSGEDTTRHPITLVWDEYMAQVLSLLSEDKKKAAVVIGKVSEILLLGRSLSVRLILACQRPDQISYSAGARLNTGCIVVLGASAKSIYEMLLPDFRDEVKGRTFGRGEGVVLLQGSELHFIKVPTVRDTERMKQLCIASLSNLRPPGEA